MQRSLFLRTLTIPLYSEMDTKGLVYSRSPTKPLVAHRHTYGIQNTTAMGFPVFPIMPNFALGNQNKKDMAQIVVNDEKQEVTLPLTLSELIKQNKIFQPEMVTVQINETFIEREDYDKTPIHDGDKIDFLYFMGGGSR